MWSKIYLAILSLAVAVMAFLTYYAWSWLQSIGAAEAAITGFEYHANLAKTGRWLFFIVLIVLANAILWTTQRAWALWLSFIYFTIGIFISNFFLDRAFIEFLARHSPSRSYTFAPLIGVIQIITVGVLTLANQFISVRLNQTMYAPPVSEPIAESEPQD